MSRVTIRPLRDTDLDEADRIFRLAFGTYVGLPDPMEFAGEADYVRTRFATAPEAAIAAELDGELVGSNFALRRGSLAYFGPLTVRPELQNQGIAQQLLAATMDVFARWGVEHAGLFTFPHSAKHVALYQKFGFWPGHLMAIMAAPVTHEAVHGAPLAGTALLSELAAPEQEAALAGCCAIADALLPGLDPSDEIAAIARLGLGDTVLVLDGDDVQAFAFCHCGPGTEAGADACFAKHAMVRPGAGEATLGRLLDGCAALAARRSLGTLTAGVSTANRAAYRHLIGRGFRTQLHGVEMHRPEGPAYHVPEALVLDDWR
ncbi:MAG TPA: GNAT family N-acetyltransferase [Candidatus Binatia bacterium]